MKKHAIVAALLVGCSFPTLAQARSHHHHHHHHHRQSYVFSSSDANAPRSSGPQSASVYGLVTQVAQAHGVDPALAHAVVKIESNYNCSAKNPHSSATGLMQTLTDTARGVGVTGNLRDCRTGLEAGMRYLKKMVAMTGGNGCAAASAYNRGTFAGCTGYGRKVVANMRRGVRVAEL